MSKVNLKHYGTKREKIVPEDLEQDVAILTLETADQVEVDDDVTGTRLSMVLSFAEFPDKVMWPNRTQVACLVTRLGEDTEDWIGAKVPVERATVKFKGQTFHKVQVCVVDEWDTFLKAVKKPRKGR